MRGKFWFGETRHANEGEVGIPVWTAPRAEHELSRAHEPLPAKDEAGEIAEFLARVYAHQQC